MDTALLSRAMNDNPAFRVNKVFIHFFLFIFFFLTVIDFLFLQLQTTLFIPTLDTMTKFVIMTISLSQNLCLRGNN